MSHFVQLQILYRPSIFENFCSKVLIDKTNDTFFVFSKNHVVVERSFSLLLKNRCDFAKIQAFESIFAFFESR
jgi:hypothetical protein